MWPFKSSKTNIPNINELRDSEDIEALEQAVAYNDIDISNQAWESLVDIAFKSEGRKGNGNDVEAVYALERIGDIKVIPILIRLLCHKKSYINKENSWHFLIGLHIAAERVLNNWSKDWYNSEIAIEALKQCENILSTKLCSSEQELKILKVIGAIGNKHAIEYLEKYQSKIKINSFNNDAIPLLSNILDSLGWKPVSDEQQIIHLLGQEQLPKCDNTINLLVDKLKSLLKICSSGGYSFEVEYEAKSYACVIIKKLSQVNDCRVENVLIEILENIKIEHLSCTCNNDRLEMDAIISLGKLRSRRATKGLIKLLDILLNLNWGLGNSDNTKPTALCTICKALGDIGDPCACEVLKRTVELETCWAGQSHIEIAKKALKQCRSNQQA